MKQKNDKYLDAIRAGHTRFKAQFARRDVIDGTAPDWSDFPIQIVELRITLRDGFIVSLTPKHVRGSGTWAEYDEHCYSGDGHFETEEWRMQLLEVIS